ncbi:MAG: response regulator [Fibrobacterota bacterium]
MTRRKPLLLHVEDDTDEREMFARVMQGRYQILSAATAEGAETALSERKIALIVLDLALPFMNGFEFLAKHKKRITSRKTPVIITTGFTSESVQQMAAAYPCSALFVKPLDLHAVQDKIRELIG